MNFIAHGIKKGEPPEAAKTASRRESEEGGGERNEKASPLEQFTQNLNQAAKDGKIDPLIGRDYEVERTIQIPPPPQEQPAAGGRGRRARRPRSPRAWPGASPRTTCPRSGRGGGVFAGHGRFAGGHQVPWRFLSKRLKGACSSTLKDKPNAILFIDEIHT